MGWGAMMVKGNVFHYKCTGWENMNKDCKFEFKYYGNCKTVLYCLRQCQINT